MNLPRVVVGLAVLCLAAAHCSRCDVNVLYGTPRAPHNAHNAPCLFAVWSRFTQEKIARLSARSTRGVFGDLWAVRVTSVSRKSEKTPGQNGLLAACKTLEMDRALLEFSAPAQRCRSDACAARRDRETTNGRGCCCLGTALRSTRRNRSPTPGGAERHRERGSPRLPRPQPQQPQPPAAPKKQPQPPVLDTIKNDR